MPDTIERLATCARQLLDAGAEIERLQEAKRRALSIADERGKESVLLRQLLQNLHAAVIGIAPFMGAEMTAESVAAWHRLNDAQATARAAINDPNLRTRTP